MAKADDLGNLILSLNPYTNRKIPYSDPRMRTGDMDIYCDAPAPGVAPAALPDKSQIEVEADGPYRQEWTFKGEPQKVGMAYRMKYRFPVYRYPPPPDPGAPAPAPGAAAPARELLYWIEDYMLIGFEGSMGG
jgi:hypothetical protein